MNQVYTKLPDDRPITALCVVEDADRCPNGYTVVSKTYDQDSDADLGRESFFFGKKCTRYLCISKTAGLQDVGIQSICIISEKEMPPKNFKSIHRTIDSEQKAWKKKQLCYKSAQLSAYSTCITDIIVLERTKKAPKGFILSGDINGMTVCYKLGQNISDKHISVNPPVPYPVLPFRQGNNSPDNSSQHDYQNLPPKAAGNFPPLLPLRPAPKPPTMNYSTLSGFNGLEGVPFVLNPKYNFSRNLSKGVIIQKIKTKSQIDEEYHYEFRTEHEM